MREIKFKAKRKDNQEWVYGFLVEYTQKDTIYIDGTSPKQSYIFPMDERSQLKSLEKRIEVIPETISQYAGLKDKNGVEIYENDIVEVVSDNWDIIEPKERKYVVEYRQDSFGIGYDLADLFDFEVIGNIYDKEVK